MLAVGRVRRRGGRWRRAAWRCPARTRSRASIRVVCEGGAAEYAFRAAAAEDGGNIGAVDPSARGLRLYPRGGGEPEVVLLDAVDPWGPEIEYFLRCVEDGTQPEQGTGEQATAALRVALAANRSLASGTAEPRLMARRASCSSPASTRCATTRVELLQELVRVDSTNPSFVGVDRDAVLGGEGRCNEILRERYEQAGLETHRVAVDPDRPNLVGVRAGSGGGRSLILNGHVDTVPRRRAGRLADREPVEPGAARRPALRARLDRHEGLGHGHVARRPGPP